MSMDTQTIAPSTPAAQSRRLTPLIPDGPAIHGKTGRFLAAASNSPPTVGGSWICPALAVAFVAALGAAVRAFYLAEHPMRYDEAYNYLHFSAKSPGYIATHYLPNNHVLHTLMVKAASAALGSSPAALRLPAFAAGVALIPATAWLALQVVRDRCAAVLAAIAAAASSPLIEYSANARGYSLLALFAVLSTGLAIDCCRPASAGRWIQWGLLAALGSYTVPVMAYPAAGQVMAAACFFLVRRLGRNGATHGRGRGQGVRGLLTGAAIWVGLTGLLYAPVLLVEGTSGFRRGTEMAYRIHGDDLGSFWHMITQTLALWARHTNALWIAALTTGFMAFVVFALWRGGPNRIVPLAAIAGSIAATAAMAAPLPPRAWLFALPIALVCCLSGLVEAARRIPSRWACGPTQVTAVALLVLVLGWPMMTTSSQSRLVAEPGGLVEVREAVEACRNASAAGCAVVSRYTPATAYYQSQMRIEALGLPDILATERVVIVADDRRPLEALWNAATPGFADFEQPQSFMNVAGATIYIAARRGKQHQ